MFLLGGVFISREVRGSVIESLIGCCAKEDRGCVKCEI